VKNVFSYWPTRGGEPLDVWRYGKYGIVLRFVKQKRQRSNQKFSTKESLGARQVRATDEGNRSRAPSVSTIAPVFGCEIQLEICLCLKSHGGPGFGPPDADAWGQIKLKGTRLNRLERETERRRWPRLPLAIPIFVRSSEKSGKESLELATAVNVSAGGALVAVRRPLPLSARVSLEVPTPPSPAIATRSPAARVLRARTVRVTNGDGYQLTGFQFLRPLVKGNQVRKAKPTES
jgi:PilZ domain